MVTGLIEDVGVVAVEQHRTGGQRRAVQSALPVTDLVLGDSVAVLTVEVSDVAAYGAGIIPHPWARSGAL